MEKILKSLNDPQPLQHFKDTREINGIPQACSYDPDFVNPDKNYYKIALLEEQHYLCAYCNKNIDNTPLHHLKIEHWYPQSLCKHELGYRTINGRDLAHENMLLVCSGENVNPNFRHCDSSRTPEATLTIKPQDPNYFFDQNFKYEGSRLISDNENVQKDIDVELNLNDENIVTTRRVVLDQFIKSIMAVGKNRINKNSLVHKYSTSGSDNRKKQYCTLILFYVQNHL